MERIPCASVVGSLNYVQTCTRPDISFAIGMLDSDYAECVDSRKSTIGYFFLLAEGTLSWKSWKQSIISTPIMEANFVTFFEAYSSIVVAKHYLGTWDP
ncbi:secreted RxLR effector protein 161-like [Silene latifolia]|uniref:secreted RxLR effector protein 161-like n=1 Tax=Silene latifolia TaxID=37657 RepID=UPI003D774AD4